MTFVAGGRCHRIVRLMVPLRRIDTLVIRTVEHGIRISTMIDPTTVPRLIVIAPITVNISSVRPSHAHAIAVVSSRSLRPKPLLWLEARVVASPPALPVDAI